METSGQGTIIKSRPELLGRFEVLRLLGEGAAGAVYHVHDRREDCEVALKVLCDREAFDEHTLLRFERELDICRTLDHPNLVKAFELIEVDNTISFTMEYISGTDLRRFLRHQSLDHTELDGIFDQLLAALGYLHSKGVVHRDIKLENILLSPEGRVTLVDFGLVRSNDTSGLTRTGVRLGTLRYLPPEYIKEGRYDHRSDLYLVGIVLYELLLGERRLAQLSGNEALTHLIRTRFAVPNMSSSQFLEKYRKIIKRAMHPNPERRYQSAEEMRAAFLLADSLGVASLKSLLFDRGRFSASSTGRLWRRWSKSLLWSLGTVVLAMGVWWIQSGLSLPQGKGYVMGFSAVGSLDPLQLSVEGFRPVIIVNSKRCLGRYGFNRVVFSCGNQRLLMNFNSIDPQRSTGTLEVDPTGRIYVFYIEPVSAIESH